jgi:protein SCO1/2
MSGPMRALRALTLAIFVTGAIGISAALYLNAPGKTTPDPAAAPFGAPFTLTDHNGEAVSEAIFRGRPAAVMFGFTSCPDICPATLAEMASWSKALGSAGKDLRFVFVSVDPERDTPAVLKDYLSAFDVPVTGITGEPLAVADMLSSHHIHSEKVSLNEHDHTMNHTASVLLLDARGHLAGTISPGEDRDNALTKLRRLVAEG